MIRSSRLVVGAMAAGVCVLGGIVWAAAPQPAGASRLRDAFLLSLAGAAAVLLVRVLRVRRALAARTRREAALREDGRSAVERSSVAATFVSAALAEGFGVPGCVAYLVTGQGAALAAAGVSLVGLALCVPAAEGLRRFAGAAELR